jgi:hypothetical protein
MISERLRSIFAEERRPLLLRSFVLGSALLLILPLRTGLLDLLAISVRVPSPDGPALLLALFFGLLLFSSPLVLFFVSWSLPGVGNTGLPRRSLIFLVLLVAYHPFRFYLDGKYYGAETLAMVARIHEQFPIVWAFKYLDSGLLLGLAIWAVLRRQRALPREKIWFNWLLFVCVLWAVGAFYDFYVGYSLPVDLRELGT